jgi:hypothetical protein
MEQATDRPEGEASDERGASKRRRGPGVCELSTERTETLSIEAPAGSRRKGFEDIIVEDLMLKMARGWIAPPPAGIVGGCGPHLIRLALGLHFHDRMTCERIAALLTGLGLAILKAPGGAVRGRQARESPRRGRGGAAGGLMSAPFVTVDDRGPATPASPASPPPSAPTGSPRSAPGRGNRARPS